MNTNAMYNLGMPKMPAGGGGLIVAAAGFAFGGYGLYNSVVTGKLT